MKTKNMIVKVMLMVMIMVMMRMTSTSIPPGGKRAAEEE